MLEIIPHPDERRAYLDLREEFRSENKKRIHERLKSHPVGWGVLGDSEIARDRYNANEWRDEMLKRMDAPVVQDFGLTDVPFTLSVRLEKQAQASSLHDSVTWEEGEDQDAPACKDVSTMTDDEIADYVEKSIKESVCG